MGKGLLKGQVPAVCGVSLVAVMGGAETQHGRAAEGRSRAGVSHGAGTTRARGRDRRAPLMSHREAGPCDVSHGAVGPR